MGKEFKLCQFADDTTIFLKDIHEVNKAMVLMIFQLYQDYV